MPEPISTAILIKLAGGVAAKMALKAYFLTKMAALKTALTPILGSQVAGIGVSAMAAACTAIYWEKRVKGSTDSAAIDAAVTKGVTRDVARGILRHLEDIGAF